jgi:hypothetical protein
MHAWRLGLFLSAVVLLPTVGNAQVELSETPPPRVSAASADWQIRGEPVVFAGNVYYPTGPNVFFDGAVMVRTGTFRGVPLYADATLEPYSVVYVPIGRMTMRPYERRREADLAGTTGSRAPSFPTDRDSELDVARPTDAIDAQAMAPDDDSSPTPLDARVQPRRGERVPATSARGGVVSRPTYVQSFPSPTSNAGIWIAYDGARWFLRGDAQPFDAARFVAVGDYRGFPVYRERSGARDDIYVPSVEGGPLAHYRR